MAVAEYAENVWFMPKVTYLAPVVLKRSWANQLNRRLACTTYAMGQVIIKPLESKARFEDVLYVPEPLPEPLPEHLPEDTCDDYTDAKLLRHVFQGQGWLT